MLSRKEGDSRTRGSATEGVGIGASAVSDQATAPEAARAPIDANQRLLLEVPGLHNFWDGKKWVVSQERLVAAAASAKVDLPTPPPIEPADVFQLARSYEGNRLDEWTGRGVSCESRCGDTTSEGVRIGSHYLLEELLGDELCRELGCEENEIVHSNESEHRIKSEDGEFRLQIVRIDTPSDMEIDRGMVGDILAQTVRSSVRDREATIYDKVGQRQIAATLEWTGIKQPRYLDTRAIHPPAQAVRFSEIDLGGFPLQEIAGADPTEKRVWLFEDAEQGFAVVHDGTQRYVVSQNPHVVKELSSLALTRDADTTGRSDGFDDRLRMLVERLATGGEFSVVLVRSSDDPSVDDEAQLRADARQLLKHPEPIFVKSTRTARGALVLRCAKDGTGAAIIESDSSEAGDILAQFLGQVSRATRGDEAQSRYPLVVAEHAASSVKKYGSVEGFFARALSYMETPIVEEEIPVTRWKTTLGSEKVEFRMIMQGIEKPALVAHYAKASLSDIAANISLGGRGRATQQVVRGLFQQELAGKVSQAEINRRAGESYEELLSMSETFARAFAQKLAESGSSRNLYDFAVDICPVWDKEAQKLQYFLLEVQYKYGFSGLEQVSPDSAASVNFFKMKARTMESLRFLLPGSARRNQGRERS